jgi:hypothetical protein
MNIKSAITMTTLIATFAVSAPVIAQENSVHQLLTGMIKQAVNSASDEIDLQIDKSLITAGNMLSIHSEAPKGNVTITDIANVNAKKDVNQTLSPDDE